MRQGEVRHVAKPLGNCIYACPKSRPHQARESAAPYKMLDGARQRSPPEPQGLETDSS